MHDRNPHPLNYAAPPGPDELTDPPLPADWTPPFAARAVLFVIGFISIVLPIFFLWSFLASALGFGHAR